MTGTDETTKPDDPAGRIQALVRLLNDYATTGCVFSIYQRDGFMWHKRGEIEGRDMAAIINGARNGSL